MRSIIGAAQGILCAALLASAAHAAPPAQPPPPPGHFAGKAPLVPLMHDCRDAKGAAIPRSRCPVTRDGRQLWAVYGSASFAPTGPLAGDVIALQPGAVTDLASIPRLVSNVYPPDGPWVLAALFHDLCYETHGYFAWHGRANHVRADPYTRAECDELLRQGMVALHVGTVQRVTIYEAVRIGGGAGWGH